MNQRFCLKSLSLLFGILFLTSPAFADTVCHYQGRLVVTPSKYIPLLGGLSPLAKYPLCNLKEIVDKPSLHSLIESMPKGGAFCFTVTHQNDGEKQMFAVPGFCPEKDSDKDLEERPTIPAGI